MLRSTFLAVAATALAAAPSRAVAQRLAVSLTPHVDVVNPGAFYRGAISVGNGPTYTTGMVRLSAFTGWGARLALRPAGLPWTLQLDATTGTTFAQARASWGDSLAGARFRITYPARLSLFSLGVARELRPAREGVITARLAGSLASTTMQDRRIIPPSPSCGFSCPGSVFEQLKPWARRYVSPGVEGGVDVSLPVRGPVALLASATFGMVRNETGDMATNQQSYVTDGSRRRESWWMPHGRLTLGIGVAR